MCSRLPVAYPRDEGMHPPWHSVSVACRSTDFYIQNANVRNLGEIDCQLCKSIQFLGSFALDPSTRGSAPLPRWGIRPQSPSPPTDNFWIRSCCLLFFNLISPVGRLHARCLVSARRSASRCGRRRSRENNYHTPEKSRKETPEDSTTN